jgi:hypothetical protein
MKLLSPHPLLLELREVSDMAQPLTEISRAFDRLESHQSNA